MRAPPLFASHGLVGVLLKGFLSFYGCATSASRGSRRRRLLSDKSWLALLYFRRECFLGVMQVEHRHVPRAFQCDVAGKIDSFGLEEVGLHGTQSDGRSLCQPPHDRIDLGAKRSEERRVGNECRG